MNVRFLIPVLILLSSCHSGILNNEDDEWSKARQIVSEISLPEIKGEIYPLEDFGGKADGLSDNHEAFTSAIEACAEAGGGTIIVGSGTWLVNGPIHLGSHMRLHLEEGAVLRFGSNPSDYLPMVLTSWEGTRCYNYSPFIYARGATDVALTGKGEIDGEASQSWNTWKEKQDPGKKRIRAMNNDGVALEERLFGEGWFLRPHLVQFYECENILVEDVKITDSPFWCLHFVFSKNITVRGLSYEAYNFNNDGIDPESSENILIENVHFGNGDDNIAIKAGRDLEARTLGRPSRNIIIRNCHFNGYNAIAVGSEMSGGVHNVFVEDCTYAGKVIYGVYLKGNLDRGGEVSNIHVRNIEFDTTTSTIVIDSNYKNQGSCCPPTFKNIYIDNIRSTHATKYGIYLKGSPQQHLDSIFISNVNIASAHIPMESSCTELIKMENVTIGNEIFEFESGLPSLTKEISQKTDREVWQISHDTAPSVASYFERQPFTDDEKYIVYSSRESGQWRLYRMNLETGVARVISPKGRKIEDDDYSLMPDGKRVCYMDGWKLYACNVETMKEEVLFDFYEMIPLPPLYTGSFTNDGRYTLAFNRGDVQLPPGVDTLTAIYRIDLETGKLLEVLHQAGGKISHPLINPEDPDLISYVPGPDTQNDMSLPMEKRARTWLIDLKAGTNRQFLTVPYGFRATHESWSYDGERFFFFRKTRPGWSPVAICSQDKNGDDFRIYYQSDSIKLGHGLVSRDGNWFISDSQKPEKNELVLVNLESGEAEILCWPNSSVTGGHSKYAHVHPSFSPNGNYVAFTSDRTGTAQVYVVPIGDICNNSDENSDL